MCFSAEFDDFYNKCLEELQGRDNYSDTVIPQLERFVLVTMKCQKLGTEIADEDVTVEHTNKVNAKNKVTSPVWRMFLELNREANALAKELKLSPVNAPTTTKKKKGGFDLGNKMKIA